MPLTDELYLEVENEASKRNLLVVDKLFEELEEKMKIVQDTPKSCCHQSCKYLYIQLKLKHHRIMRHRNIYDYGYDLCGAGDLVHSQKLRASINQSLVDVDVKNYDSKEIVRFTKNSFDVSAYDRQKRLVESWQALRKRYREFERCGICEACKSQDEEIEYHKNLRRKDIEERASKRLVAREVRFGVFK